MVTCAGTKDIQIRLIPVGYPALAPCVPVTSYVCCKFYHGASAASQCQPGSGDSRHFPGVAINKSL